MSIKAWGSFAILIFIILNTNLIAQTTGSVLFVDGVGVEALNYGSGEPVRMRVVDADVNTGSGSVQTLQVLV
ncbi:MAG: hypothetical protein JJ966_03205, partial [Balneolaceae bacterium]|nr:hypothetical protein [Balneolaceae bacterium]